ncbi:Basic proline-rich protein precursor [Brucella sp. 10RB9215]|uniref:flagellar biosynthetic protein FliO n=1 Tax=Brucella sp. 10RB9215 TaxID=1149953 RepID=UPI00090A8BFD|nr:flagellar biosynthetic protein FliO [Brucella sp. 10RB9215]SBW13846.1 Basic proline-rich protein precursor [Brucella sp. 10RB9215]
MKEWLSGIIGESAANIVGFVLIFAIILGGIFVVLGIIRRFSGGTFVTSGRMRQPRLSVMDAAAVDSRRKLVLIRRDDVEHLLLIGGPTDVVVEQNIVLESRAGTHAPGTHALGTHAQSSRIEPEHIERFRQHEVLANEKTERPALSVQPQPGDEREETIQLSSAIAAPVYRKPEPPKAENVRPAPSEPAPMRAPQPPVTPPPAAPRPEAPASQVSEPHPRPASNYPSQPRTVLPPRPAPSAAPNSVRAHPAYPLSQVSRGVVSSTSNIQTATVASAATANLGSIVPERESAAPAKPAAPAPNQPERSERPQRPQQRIEPVVPFAAQEVRQPESADDDLDDLGGALHDAIMADLGSNAGKDGNMEELDTASLEDELLSSLDISPTDEQPEDAKAEETIEDEMEKLLGELTKGENRN